MAVATMVSSVGGLLAMLSESDGADQPSMAMLRPPVSPPSLSSSFALASPLHALPAHLAPPRWRWKRLPKSASVCKASWQELAGVLVFSAIPFTAVKAIANSPLGESLQRRMEERKKFGVENSSRFRALTEKARKER